MLGRTIEYSVGISAPTTEFMEYHIYLFVAVLVYYIVWGICKLVVRCTIPRDQGDKLEYVYKYSPVVVNSIVSIIFVVLTVVYLVLIVNVGWVVHPAIGVSMTAIYLAVPETYRMLYRKLLMTQSCKQIK